MHAGGKFSFSEKKPKLASSALLAHNDINAANIVYVNDRVKFNDFNVGVLLRTDERSGNMCGFQNIFDSAQVITEYL